MVNELRNNAMRFCEEWVNNSEIVKTSLQDIEHGYNVQNNVKLLMEQLFITGMEYGVDLVYNKLGLGKASQKNTKVVDK